AGPRSHRNSSPRIPLDSLRRASWPAAHRLAHALRPFGAGSTRRRCCHRRRTDDCVTVNAEFSHKSIGLPILSKVSIPDSLRLEYSMTSASARGLATITHDGTVLDVWFPAVSLDTPVTTAGTERLEETPQQFAALVGPDEERGVA